MRIFSMARTAAIVMLGALTIVGTAVADPMWLKYSGWTTNTGIDTDGDGTHAYNSTSAGFSTWGPIRANIMSEGPPLSEYCDGDSNGSDATDGHSTIIIQTNKGDQIYGRRIGGTSCFDQTTSTIQNTGNFEITGGSGRFENATGYVIDTATIFCLGVNHCAQTGFAEGEILLAQ